MLKIGITGGIGSGKTTVCQIFEVFGIPVFYADTAAKSVMHSDVILREALVETFGPGTYHADGNLNRRYLADKVFNDSLQLQKLNDLVHPAVFRAFDRWVEEHRESPYVLKEAALLFESGSYRDCDFTILVEAPAEMRIARVMKRDQISKEQVLARIARQLDDREKEKLADCVLMNDEKELLVPQVLELHRSFLTRNPIRDAK